MNDFEEQVRAAAERARQRGAELADGIDPLAPVGIGNSARRGDRNSRWVLIAASVLVVSAGVASLVIMDGRRSEVAITTDGAPTSTSPTSTTTTTSTTSTTSTTIVDDVQEAELATPVVPQPAVELSRPIVDPDVCESYSAYSDTARGSPPNAVGLPLTLFARSSSLPVPIQVIGYEVDGPTKPFAVVQRFFDSDRNPRGEESVLINGLDVYVATHPNGNGEAAWNLPDGSQGYLRSRGLSRGDLLTILAALSPRAIDGEIPGFDYTNNEKDGLELVAEQMNTNVTRGMGVGSQCRIDGTDYLYRVDTVEGDALIRFAVVIDRPPPVDVGMVNETLVIISGGDHPGAPKVSDVINADNTTWQNLLDLPGSVAFVELDSGGGVHGPVMYWRQRDRTESEQALITGRLELDSDCLYLVDDFARYPVLWEFGTRWRADPPAVVLPDGTAIALGGTLQSGGGYHPSDQLDSFTTSADVEALATRCADNEWNQVAVIQGPVDR